MITPEQAAELVRVCAREMGWGVMEPLVVTARRNWNGTTRHYEIVSDPAKRGTCLRMIVDAKTGSIIEKGYLPR